MITQAEFSLPDYPHHN